LAKAKKETVESAFDETSIDIGGNATKKQVPGHKRGMIPWNNGNMRGEPE
jgi:hypothetical protein